MKKYGKVIRTVVPKPKNWRDKESDPAVGKVYIKFADTTSSTVAMNRL